MVRSRIPGTVQRFLGSCSFEEPYQSEMVWPKKGTVPLTVRNSLAKKWYSTPNSHTLFRQKQVQYP